MALLDVMIQTNRLYEFVCEIIKIRNEEMEDKAIWEMWLHKVFDQSFADFKAKLTNTTIEPNKEDIEATVIESYKMLEGFHPDGVNENDGIVSAAGDSSDRHSASGTVIE